MEKKHSPIRELVVANRETMQKAYDEIRRRTFAASNHITAGTPKEARRLVKISGLLGELLKSGSSRRMVYTTSGEKLGFKDREDLVRLLEVINRSWQNIARMETIVKREGVLVLITAR